MKKDYRVEKKKIPSPGGEMDLLILKPTTNAKSREKTPGILWIHGGGYAVPAQVDVYPTGFHAFDMLMPFRKISKEAIKKFEEAYVYAVEHYHT